MPHRSTVLPKQDGPDETKFKDLLVAGLARVAAKITKPTLAKAMGRTTRQLDNIMAGALPEAPAIFDTLLVDPTTLDELFASYGFQVVPRHSAAANDLVTAAGVINAMGELISALSDGVRDHNETLAVATLLRPHIGAIQAIVTEADRLRGAA